MSNLADKLNFEAIERGDERRRRPTHPGEVLREEFLKCFDITQTELAEHIGCDNKTINRLVNEHTGITPKMAQKLASAFNTTPDFWLNLQRAVNLFEVRQEDQDLPGPIISSEQDQRRPCVR